MNRPVSTATARMMFMAGPANTMIKRCQRGLLKKLRGSLACSSPGLFAHHLHVTAEKDGGKAKVGVALLEAEQTGAKSEAESVHLDIEESRRPVMTKLVNQDHDADHYQRKKDVLQNIEAHIKTRPLPAAAAAERSRRAPRTILRAMERECSSISSISWTDRGLPDRYAVERLFHHRSDGREGDLPSEKRFDRDFVGGVQRASSRSARS